ncbi:hypothetical protein EDD16DRAFT_1610463 [Pisolithus croceorrhizus]|nr:hypothetical protein EDD16DRAFT_1610463 [Pisolithus croceorrhizus]
MMQVAWGALSTFASKPVVILTPLLSQIGTPVYHPSLRRAPEQMEQQWTKRVAKQSATQTSAHFPRGIQNRLSVAHPSTEYFSGGLAWVSWTYFCPDW